MAAGEQPRWVDALVEAARTVPVMRRCGTVVEIVGLTIESRGPVSRVGEVCSVSRGLDRRPLLAEVCGFREDRVLLLPIGRADDVEPGARVTALGEQLRVPVGEELLGRVIDGTGRPLDDRGPIRGREMRPTRSEAPAPMSRQRVTEPLWV
ncbi:MAG: EscN/YscN/HrcN family type III secretion system ATPase, partial [Armatimonadota bacterium]